MSKTGNCIGIESGYQGLGVEGNRVAVNGYEAYFRGVGGVLDLVVLAEQLCEYAKKPNSYT